MWRVTSRRLTCDSPASDGSPSGVWQPTRMCLTCHPPASDTRFNVLIPLQQLICIHGLHQGLIWRFNDVEGGACGRFLHKTTKKNIALVLVCRIPTSGTSPTNVWRVTHRRLTRHPPVGDTALNVLTLPQLLIFAPFMFLTFKVQQYDVLSKINKSHPKYMYIHKTNKRKRVNINTQGLDST